MAKQLQLRRGTTAQHSTFTGAVGEVTIDTDKDVVVVHDGATAGGFPSQKELVSGTNIKTINSTTVLGSGNISVQPVLVSGTNIKTVNSTSILGSGNLTVQESLVSGTNIKTVNSSSLLSSGDISLVAKDSTTGAAIIPAGTEAQRPVTPSIGMLRFNTETNKHEGYNGSIWTEVAGGGTKIETNIVATNGQTVFTVSYTVGAIDVFVNGLKIPTTEFTATNGTSITLNSGLNAGDIVDIVVYGTFNVANTYTKAEVDATAATKQATLVSGTNIKTVNSTSLLGSGDVPIFTGFKNRIINGDMRIDQRNAGASSLLAATAYYLDRWQFAIGANLNNKFTVGRNLNSVTPPSGFTNYLGLSTTTSITVTTNDYGQLRQSIEGFNTSDFGWGAAGAQSVTLSFWVCASVTGTYAGVLQNAAENRTYVFTINVNAANTWELKTVTIVGDTSGVWATNNTKGLTLIFNLGTGSAQTAPSTGSWLSGNYLTASGAVNLVANSGATFYITGVQLEKGSTATSFEYRPYGTELALCQRYYQVLTMVSSRHFIGLSDQNKVVHFANLPLPGGTMRTAPSVSAGWTTATVMTGGGFYPGSVTYLGGNASSSMWGFTANYTYAVQSGSMAIIDLYSPNNVFTFSAEL